MASVISKSEVYGMEGNHRVFVWEVEKLKLLGLESKESHWSYSGYLKVLSEGEGKVNFGLCTVSDYYGEVSYPRDEKVHSEHQVTKEAWEQILQLTSEAHKVKLEEEKRSKYLQEVKEFKEAKLDTMRGEFELFVDEITQEYFQEVFNEPIPSQLFSMTAVVAGAVPNFVETVYQYHKFDWTLPKEEVKGEDNEVESEEVERTLFNLRCQFFFNHYSFLGKFAQEMFSLCKGGRPNMDCLLDSKVGDLNVKYGLKLLKFALSLS